MDLNIENWSLQQLKGFCAMNDIDVAGCSAREDYIRVIEKAGVAE